jgi:hypothetical protein
MVQNGKEAKSMKSIADLSRRDTLPRWQAFGRAAGINGFAP